MTGWHAAECGAAKHKLLVASAKADYGVRPIDYYEPQTMTEHQSKDPMHGVTLEQLLNKLVENYGWSGLAERIRINCFSSDPSIKSSLKFLRRTPWARKQVEDLYIDMVDKAASDNPWLRGGE
jgi:uncharacterized protein (DUF2132 family)